MAVLSTWQKYTATVVAVVEMLFFSGVIYGWANLVLILKNEGYFSDLCDNGNLTATTGADDCPEQSDRLTLAFTLAAFSFNAAGFLAGTILDRYGTRVTRLAACALFFLIGLLAFFVNKDNANLIFPIMVFLAFAGMFTAVTIFQISELHPNHRLAISSSVSGALDSSSVVFLIFKLCYDNGASFRWILVTYCVIAIIWILANSFIFMPKTTFSLEMEEPVQSDMALGETNPGLAVSVDNLAIKEGENKNGNGPQTLGKDNLGNTVDPDSTKRSPETTVVSQDSSENEKYASGWRYVLTSRYMWLLFYLSLLQLRLWFFVGSLNTFLVYQTKNDKDLIDKYSAAFGLTQFFGFVFAPFTGIIMEIKTKHSNNPYFGPAISFVVTNVLCLILGVFVLIPVLEVQYVSFVVQVTMRAFLYASVVSFIIKAFPIQHFGKLYGVSMVTGAVFLLLQYPVFIILEGPFDGKPFWVNLGFLVVCLAGFALPLALVVNNKENKEIVTKL